MNKLALTLSLALVSLTTSLSAQMTLPITLTGRVEAAAPGACDSDATHRVSCTEVLLKSSTVDLNAFEGRTVDLSGTLDPILGCISVEVDAIAAAEVSTSQIAIFGTGLGRTVAYTTISPPGSVIIHLFGCESGFLPLGQFGTFLMGVQDTIFMGAVLSIGIDLRAERIPNNPALVGVQIWSQFAYASLIDGIEVKLLNTNCLTIQQ